MKLNQVIALVAARKPRAQKLLTEAYRNWRDVTGISRSYAPATEDGQQYPPEHKKVTVHVEFAMVNIFRELTDWINLVATQEYANQTARADIVIAGKTIAESVPVTTLLFLQRFLVDLHALAESLPQLPPDKAWNWDEAQGCWCSDAEETIRTAKCAEVIVKYGATMEHPAQTELVTLDKPAGTWTTVHHSGALSGDQKAALLKNIVALQDAVKVAREDANGMYVSTEETLAEKLFDYVAPLF